MANSEDKNLQEKQGGISAQLEVASSPHISAGKTTRGVMLDVIIALIPATATGIYVFGWRGAMQVGICVSSCVLFEWLYQAIRRKPQTIGDLSAIVTGLILALSIPWTAPWYVAVVASGAAIILAKMIFGGLGANIFNPAMAGRAFVQACFSGEMTSYLLDGKIPPPHAPFLKEVTDAGIRIISKATPLAAAKFEHATYAVKDLAVGTVNGSVGETGAIACLIGGIYLLLRRTASWRIPVGVLLTAAVVVVLTYFGNVSGKWVMPPQKLFSSVWDALGFHLFAGALMFGAFFIATDPATSPITPKGQWIFAFGVGLLIMLIRLFANVPEGVMYSVLVMNTTVPLIDRWTIRRPLGGPVVAKKE